MEQKSLFPVAFMLNAKVISHRLGKPNAKVIARSLDMERKDYSRSLGIPKAHFIARSFDISNAKVISRSLDIERKSYCP